MNFEDPPVEYITAEQDDADESVFFEHEINTNKESETLSKRFTFAKPDFLCEWIELFNFCESQGIDLPFTRYQNDNIGEIIEFLQTVNNKTKVFNFLRKHLSNPRIVRLDSCNSSIILLNKDFAKELIQDHRFFTKYSEENLNNLNESSKQTDMFDLYRDKLLSGQSPYFIHLNYYMKHCELPCNDIRKLEPLFLSLDFEVYYWKDIFRFRVSEKIDDKLKTVDFCRENYECFIEHLQQSDLSFLVVKSTNIFDIRDFF